MRLAQLRTPFLTSVLLALAATGLFAQSTWTGAVSSSWGVAGNWSAGVPSSSVDVTIPSGTPNAPSTAGVAGSTCHGLTIASGATVTLVAGFPLDVTGAVAMSGGISGGGLLRLSGSASGNLTGGGTIGASLEIARGGGTAGLSGDFTVTGNLTQTSGTFFVSFGIHTMSVGGNASFQGGSLQISSGGTIAVAGNVTFSGTSVAGPAPTIQCAGNWTSDASYAPVNGTVVFDGVGAHSISVAGSLPTVTIASTLIASIAALHTTGPLTVNGSLAVSPGSLDADDNVIVAGIGTLTLGNTTNSFGRSLTVSGAFSVTGTLVMDGSGSGSISCSLPLPNLQISKTGSGSSGISSDVTVTGNLTQTSGDFFVSFGTFTLSVAGSAFFQGGSLLISSNGTIDVAGNVTFSGTSVTSTTPTIQCAGAWSSDASYAPVNGAVVFDGVGAQTITASGSLPTVTIASTSNASSTGLHTTQVLTVNGSLVVSPGSLDADDNVTVAGSGTLNLLNTTNSFGRNLTVNGAFSVTGTVVMDGSSSGSISCSLPLPNLQISKTGSGSSGISSDVTVTGNLTQTSGDFFVSFGTFTLSVAGSASFQGGSLLISSNGTIDVAGNVTFSGTSVASTTPTIQCAGNWSSDASYAPFNGSVIFDRVGAQTITVAGNLPSVSIESTSNASIAALHTTGPLTVNGSLVVSPGSLDADDNVTVAGSGTLNLLNTTNSFGRNLTVNGAFSATGTIVLDGSSGSTVSCSAPFPSLQISKAIGSSVGLASNLTATGNLTQTSGDFFVSFGAFTLTVGGNALFQGGSLQISSTGTLDVAGNVTFAGTSVTGTTPTIKCAGNWSSDAAFAPSGGTIELDGAAPSTIAHAVSGGVIPFPIFAVKNGSRSTVGAVTIVSQSSTTIDSTGSLSIGGGSRLVVHVSAAPTSCTVNGSLLIGAGSELALGPQTTATVAATGSLSLIGTPALPARIAGEAGGGYSLTVSGALAAKNFLVKEMGPTGMVVNASSAFAAPPEDFRGGTFDFRVGAPAGSVLLDLRRPAPADLRYCVFQNTPGAAGVFNVKTQPGSAPFSFTNFTGALSGPGFESDPNNLIAWNPPEQSTLALFVVVPGAELAEVSWKTATEVDLAGFEVHRASNVAGPYTFVASASVLGPPGYLYGITDAPLPANQPVFYKLFEKLTHDALVELASGSTTPYSAATPGNVYKVGGGGPFPTIQDAVNAATAANSVVQVTPGTYAAFSIGASAPSNLHVLADGTGPVTIDTSSGPIQIANVPASSGIELSDLVIGSAATSQPGIVVTNCACPVVLDTLTVGCGAGQTAVSVSGSPAMAVQRCDIAGGTGLLVTAGSYVALSRGSLSSLVSTGSTIEMASLTPGSVSVTPASSLLARSGTMPDVNLPEFVKLSEPSALFLDAFPNSPFIVIASPRLGFTTVNPFEMPVLIDQVGMAQLPILFTDALGQAAVGFEIAPIAALLGFTYVVQVGVLDPSSVNWRFSNVETMVAMP